MPLEWHRRGFEESAAPWILAALARHPRQASAEAKRSWTRLRALSLVREPEPACSEEEAEDWHSGNENWAAGRTERRAPGPLAERARRSELDERAALSLDAANW